MSSLEKKVSPVITSAKGVETSSQNKRNSQAIKQVVEDLRGADEVLKGYFSDSEYNIWKLIFIVLFS